MPEEAQEQAIDKLFSGFASRASSWFFYLVIFLFPLFALPYTAFPVGINKSYLAYFSILLIGIIYLASSLQAGKIIIPKSLFSIFLLVFIVSLAASSFFSKSPHASFSGLGSEVGTLGALAIFAVTLFLAFWILNSEERGAGAFLALFGSFLISILFQFFQTILKIPLFPAMGQELTFNLFGSWNEFGILSGLVVLLSAIFIEYLPRSFLKIICWVMLVLGIIASALVNFNIVWWVLASILVILLAYRYSQNQTPKSIFQVTFGVFIIMLIFTFSRNLISDFVTDPSTGLGIQFIEVRPNPEFTLKVASSALAEDAAFGYGPNTFIYAWFNHRPAEINGTPFWQARFNSGFSFILTLLTTAGLVGVLAFLAFLGLFLWYGFKALVKQRGSFLLLASFVGALYLWIFTFIYPTGFAVLFLAFLFSGIFLGLAAKKGILGSLEVSLFEHSGPGFVGALLMILFIVLGVSWFSLLAQKYYAAILYGEGVRALAAGEIGNAEGFISRAIRFDRRDLYFRSMTDAGILRLQQIVSRQDASPDELRAQFQTALAETIQNAQEASSLNQADPLNWMNLGRVYEAVMPFRIQGAAEFALGSYLEASKRFPSSPEPILAQARVELLRNDLPRAREFLKQAISLKSDYAQAHFLLAQLEATTGNVELAIQSAETTALLAPNDIGVLFQLGLLYYQNQRFDESRAVLERAVSLNSNYSNARYFLGLIYARQGDRNKSLGEFQKIAELNPSNAEVKRIIENLIAGREPLFGISPPGPRPERRSRAPLEE